MSINQTYNNCSHFKTKTCSNSDNKLMLQLISELSPSLLNHKPFRDDTPQLMEIINNTLCKDCANFTRHQ